MIVLATLMVTACSSPDPAYYTLQPVDGRALPGPRKLIKLEHPGLAGYLDRSDIVLQQADYRLNVDSQVRWGEPLADMIGRVLTQDLTQRLPGSSVFSSDGAIGADADVRVEVDVQRFDREPDGSVSLTAELAIEAGQSHVAVATHAVSLHVPGVAPGPAALAAAMSQLLGDLADQAATDIRSTAPAARMVTP